MLTDRFCFNAVSGFDAAHIFRLSLVLHFRLGSPAVGQFSKILVSYGFRAVLVF
jgi:hypothetical protein